MNIEKVTVEDAEELLSIYAPYVQETAISFECEVPSLEEFRDRIHNISAILPYIKAVENEKVLGYAYAGRFKGRKAYDWSVEVTVYVKKEARRSGIGRMLYTALEDSLKQMGVLNMNACISVPRGEDEHLTNDSVHFHRRMGFEEVGTFHNSGYKFDTWYDMIWMEKMIGEHTEQQEEVRFGEWMILRSYQPSDCEEMAELFYQTVHSVNAKDYTREQLDVWATGTVDLEAWNQSFLEHDTVVAVQDDRMVGFGDMDRSGYLDRLYVHKDYQRQGIATSICDRLEREVTAGKITTHASITAKPFFQKRGYEVIKEQQVIRGGVALTNYVMEYKTAVKQRNI